MVDFKVEVLLICFIYYKNAELSKGLLGDFFLFTRFFHKYGPWIGSIGADELNQELLGSYLRLFRRHTHGVVGEI